VDVVKLERNPSVGFCKRPTDMIDTIVIHHSETSPTTSPEQINDMHLNQQWYMAGYTFMVNSAYPNSSKPRLRATEGRPIEYVGAHAGTGVFVKMNELQKKLWNEGKIICGTEEDKLVKDETLMQGDKIKANVTTIGLVVIGNYAPMSVRNPNGYGKLENRAPTLETLDGVARLACQIQKKYPLIKNIKWHSFYHSTDCPGDLKKYVPKIRDLTKKYGCEFY